MRRWIVVGRALWIVMVGAYCWYLTTGPAGMRWWETIGIFSIGAIFGLADWTRGLADWTRTGADHTPATSRRLEMLDREIERLERLQEELRKEKAVIDARIERLMAVLHIVLEWNWAKADLAIDLPFLNRLMEAALKDEAFVVKPRGVS